MVSSWASVYGVSGACRRRTDRMDRADGGACALPAGVRGGRQFNEY